MRVAAAAVAACCAALAVAGCGTRAVDGQADPVGAAAGEPAFSPCDDIPDEVVRSLGLDPATEERDIDGVDQPGWNICGWLGTSPALSVFATTHTVAEVKAKEGNVDFVPVSIGSRNGFTYRDSADRDGRNCDVALESAGGAVLVSVAYLGVDPVLEDPCAVAVRGALALDEFLPG